MPCYYPVQGYRARRVNPETGKRAVVFDPRDGYADMPVTVPCGRCIGCRLERSRQWAVRCMHEASMHEENCFITLTYSDDHLPPDGSLHVEHYQKFMKRLRRRYDSRTIRFFHCGEYGDTTNRPHYHACLFGFDFPDKVLFRETEGGNRLYISDSLADLWPFGFSTIGDVTFESAAYVARYVMKKITGPDAEDHYQGRKPEYTTMSRRPGIGKEWFDKYGKEVYAFDEVIVNGHPSKPPRYYDNQYEICEPDHSFQIKHERQYKGRKFKEHSTLDRLRVREKVKKAQIKSLKRSID